MRLIIVLVVSVCLGIAVLIVTAPTDPRGNLLCWVWVIILACLTLWVVFWALFGNKEAE